MNGIVPHDNTIPPDGMNEIKRSIFHGFKQKVKKHGIANVKVERNTKGMKFTFWIDDTKGTT